jgi:hypothetical protein
MKTSSRFVVVAGILLVTSLLGASNASAAEDVRCVAPTIPKTVSTSGFACEYYTFSDPGMRGSGVTLFFNGLDRGFTHFERYSNGTKHLVICDNGVDDHGGPAVRIDTGSTVVQYSTREGECRSIWFSYAVRKYRLTWANGWHTTQWFPAP